MAFLDLMRVVSIQRRRRRLRRQAQAPRDELIASRAKRKGSPCQPGDDSQDGETEMYSRPNLPNDIWCHIHSLMPMRDAARAACVSRAFLCSWRRHPDLQFDTISFSLGLRAYGNNKIAKYFSSKVDQILNKHSGIGVKRLKIQPASYNQQDSSYLNRWLQIAVTPGIEELTLSLPMKSKYSFPYTLLCNTGGSIRSFRLVDCSLSPTAEVGWLRRLTRLYLQDVHVGDNELGHLLSNSFALEQLDIRSCDWIVCLKIPCSLLRLMYLNVNVCRNLQVLEIKAPNIHRFNYFGEHEVELSLGEKLQMKHVDIFFPGAVRYAHVELPSSMPNLETLSINSFGEVGNTLMLHSKFLHLKNLRISLSGVSFPRSYDYFILVSFLDACPYLEDFLLDVPSGLDVEHLSVFTDDSNMRQMQEHHHHKIKRVKILGFFCSKSLVELTCHVVECASSLECITLDASQCQYKCSPVNKFGRCFPVPTARDLMEATRALQAIRTYIEPKVPSTVKLDVVEPCSRCRDV